MTLQPIERECESEGEPWAIGTSSEASAQALTSDKRAACCLLIPYFECPEALARTLQSIDLDDPTYDVLVIDDGSLRHPIDETLQKLGLGGRIRRVRLAENMGIEGALNAGLRLCVPHYTYIARLDCGDLQEPGRIARQVDFLVKNPNVGIVGSWVRFEDEHGAPLYTLQQPASDRAIRRRMRVNCAFTHPSVIIRSSAAKAAGFYPVNRPAAEDFAYFFQLLKISHGANLQVPLVRCLIDPHGISNLHRRRQLVSRIRVMLDNFELTPIAVYGLLRAVIQLVTPRNLTVRVLRSWERSRLADHGAQCCQEQ